MTIHFDHVTFTYPGTIAPALRDVTVDIAGGVTLVTGPLGAGCSTLLLVGAALAPHVTGGSLAGGVTTLGIDTDDRDARRRLAGRVGLLQPTPWTQLSGISYTVWDEVAFGPANLGWERARVEAAVTRALDVLDIGHLAARDPATLSGGELQRVILAGVVAMEPALYLLDEPALELDAEGAEAIYALLPVLARDAAVVVASADVDRAVQVADRVLVLHAGAVVGAGRPADVLGTERAVLAGWSTTVAALMRGAGLSAPFPLTVTEAVDRLGA